MAKKAKEILKLYTVKYGAVKEMYTSQQAAEAVAIANNVNVSITSYMERPDKSVYTVVNPLKEE